MGFLEVGAPMSWRQSQAHIAYVRRAGVRQFIHTYNRLKDRTNDVLKWGDEVRRRGGARRSPPARGL
jgi:glutamate--cysteine ligase catalytic subunit